MASGDSEKALNNAQQYVYARDAGHLDFIHKARRCEDFFDSYPDKQWDEGIARKLRAQGKPALTIGKILPTLAVVMGEQLSNQVDVAFRHTSSGNPDTARALDKVWIHIRNSNKFVYTEADVADDGFITSRGFFDVRMDFSDNIRGDVRISRLNPKNVVLDPDASEYDPSTWSQVFVTDWQTPMDVGAVYGEAFAKELVSRPQSAFAYGGHDFLDFPRDGFGKFIGFQNLVHGPDGAELRRYVRVIERQYKERRRVAHFIDIVTGEKRPIPPTWAADRIALAVQTTGVVVADLWTTLIRWTVSADDVLLLDSISPFEYFTPVPFFPYFVRGRTIGMVEGLIGSQEGLNKSRSQELHIVNSTANSGWKLKSGSLRGGMTREMLEEHGADTGLVIELASVEDAQKIEPNPVPTGLDRVSYKFDQDMLTLSNIGPGMRSVAREDVSGKALQHQEVRGAISHARPMMNLVRSEEMVVERVRSLVQRFYTDQRMLVITRNDIMKTTEEVTINEPTPEGEILNDLTLGEYAVSLTTVPQREQHEDTVFSQGVALKELGVDVPDEVLIANSRLPNKQEILEGMQPTEESERLSELQMAMQEAELEKLKTENMDRRASAVERVARAKRSVSEGTPDESGELALKKYEIDKRLEFERYKFEKELALDQEKMRREARLAEIKQKAQSNANAKKRASS